MLTFTDPYGVNGIERIVPIALYFALIPEEPVSGIMPPSSAATELAVVTESVNEASLKSKLRSGRHSPSSSESDSEGSGHER